MPVVNDSPSVLMDVTLRDGGFQNGFCWSLGEIKEIVLSLAKTGIEFIEIGYVGGVPELHNVKNIGISANLTAGDILEIKSHLVDNFDKAELTKLVAMIHPTATDSPYQFSKLKQAGLDMVRFVYHPSWKERLSFLHNEAKSCGLLTSVNLALISRYSSTDIDSLLDAAYILDPDAIYIADTCSALVPSDVRSIPRPIETGNTTLIGFHAHDFLTTAFSNSLQACYEGYNIVDSSVFGIGRGAGNLRTELWILYQCLRNKKDYAVENLGRALEIIGSGLSTEPSPDLASIGAGLLNLSPPQEDELRAIANPNTYLEAIMKLNKQSNGRFGGV